MKKLKPLLVKIKGNKKFYRLLDDTSKTRGLRCGYVNLKTGQDIGEHDTGIKEEVLLVLSGRARVSFENRPFLAVESNSLVYIPPHTKHNVKNFGRSMLHYIYIVAFPKEA